MSVRCGISGEYVIRDMGILRAECRERGEESERKRKKWGKETCMYVCNACVRAVVVCDAVWCGVVGEKWVGKCAE